MLILESTIIVMGVLLFALMRNDNYAKTEVYRQSSKDGTQTVVIYEIGEPDWAFGSAHYRVYGPSDFFVDVADDGGHGSFEVQWDDASVTIIFCGQEQADAVYVLPFK